MKLNMRLVVFTVLIPLLMSPAGCSPPAATPTEPDAYPDAPEDQRHERLSIYIAWDGFNETWDYEVSAESVISESGPPSREEAEDGIVFEDIELPGGRTLWFKGLSPGDVVLTFTIKTYEGEAVDIQRYTIRVYDDLRLAILHSESTSLRS